MLDTTTIVIIFGIILTLVHYFSENIVYHFKKYRMKLVSFSAGISLAYFFLMLMPEIYGGMLYLDKFIFVYILIGFILFHLMEKYIYQHEEKNRLLEELKEAHSLVFFVYHFVVGMVLVKITMQNAMDGLLLFIPLLFHLSITNVSLKEIHRKITERKFVRFFLCLSTILGIVFASFIEISAMLYFTLFAFIGGAILYIVIREEIPEEDRKGKPAYFIAGTFLYSLLIIVIWMM